MTWMLTPDVREWVVGSAETVESVNDDQKVIRRRKKDLEEARSRRRAMERMRKVQDYEKSRVDKGHAELLSAIHSNGWEVSRPQDVVQFSQRLNAHASANTEARFYETILSRLYFRHLPDRYDSIPTAHVETFQWLFSEDIPVGSKAHWNSFPTWVQESNSEIYWIAGKPGSGKSTLMKYLYHHHSLSALLEQWTQGKPLTKAGFYFWNSGSAMQMSHLGLLQALVHACGSDDMNALIAAMPERWQEYVAYGGGVEPFQESELRRIFRNIISDESRRFFFLIDGLDEFSGEPREIINFVLDTVRPNVKICVASRPWIPFEDAFQQRPSLLLQWLTHRDIVTYVTEHFHENEHFVRLRACYPAESQTLIPKIVEKASGVFLWVYLVVQSLLEGLSNADRMSDLQARLAALPSDLEALFDVILARLRPTGRLQPNYYEQACETFRLLRAYREAPRHILGGGGNPTLLALYFADDPDTTSSFRAAFSPMGKAEICQKTEQMRRRIKARSGGLLEMQRASLVDDQDEEDMDIVTIYDHTVSYLHRTARDYMESEEIWQTVLEASGYAAFPCDKRWANAHLWLQKTSPRIFSSAVQAVESEYRCLDIAITIQERTGVFQQDYLEEVLRATARDYGIKRSPHAVVEDYRIMTEQVRVSTSPVADGAASDHAGSITQKAKKEVALRPKPPSAKKGQHKRRRWFSIRKLLGNP